MRAIIGSLMLILLGLIIFSAIIVGIAHSSISTTPTQPEHRAQEQGDVVATIYGRLLDGKVMGNETATFTNIRFQPYGRELLYDESVLFCDFVGDRFNGVTGSVKVSYEARAHKMYQGIGCHELLSVDNWTPPQRKGL